MYTVSKSIRIAKAAEGAIVLSLEAGKVLRLNPTGVLILEHLRTGATESEIIHSLASQFHIANEIASRDATDFIERLEQLGVIRRDVGDDQRASGHSCDGQLS
jgi:hypothetical protein